jgi:hypothetical protein
MNDLNRRSLIGDEFFSFTRKDLFLKLILLFPITTLFQYHIGVLNKLVFFAVLVVLFAVQGVRKKPLAYLFGISLLWLFSMAVTPLAALTSNLNMAFYYIFLVFYLVFVLTEQEEFWNLLIGNRRFIYYTVLLYTLIVTVSIFLPSSYNQSEVGGWGDEAYFTSISGSPNRVGPASVFVVILIAFLIQTGSSRALAFLAVPQLYVFLMGGSRTYFVVGACAIVVLYYVMVPRKKWFFLSLIPFGAVGLVLVLNSNMMDKFAATFQTDVSQEEFWRSLTNSRSVFWVEQLKMFFNTPWYKQLLGNGINFTTYNYGLWAHSDFIEILCSYGYVGLANYLALMAYTMHKLMKTKKHHFFIKCIVVFIWFFNAFFNFFYCYFCAMLCFPILLLIVKHIDDQTLRRA